MVDRKSAFKNQRPTWRELAPPYAEKSVEDPRYQFPSRKNDRGVSCWTAAEHLAAVAFETAPPALLKGYEERPHTLDLRDGAERYLFTPSFTIQMADGEIVVELTPRGEPRGKRQETVARLARHHYARRNIRFVELSHAQIRARPRARTAGLLIRYLASSPSATETLLARDAVRSGTSSVLGIEQISGLARNNVMAIIRRGGLAIDWRDHFTVHSAVSLVSNGGVQ